MHPHRAAFVTSLSRWYIRRLLGNLPPFHPLPVCGEEASVLPLRDFATLRTILPGNQGTASPFCLPPSISGTGRGKWQRSAITGDVSAWPPVRAQRRQTVANLIKSHNHSQPTHTHSFSGQLVSTALSGTAAGQRYSSTASLSVSGTAAGQRYSDDAVLWTTNYYNAADVSGGSGPIRSSNIRSNISTKTAKVQVPFRAQLRVLSPVRLRPDSVSGNLQNGTVSGTIGAGGGAPTDYTGSSETAPDHIYVRCLIRAKP